MSQLEPLVLRTPPPQLSKSHLAIWGVNLLCGLGLCLLGSEQASYALSPGMRAPQLTLRLDDPLPYVAAPTPSPVVPVPSLADRPDVLVPLSLPSAFDTGVAAQPFDARGLSVEDLQRAETCLTDAIYYEAASETEDGQRAVAQVVLNRVRHPAWPKTICGVIYQGSDMPGCQFSYACDGSLRRARVPAIWAKMAIIARAALAGDVYAPIGLATHYHTLRVNPIWNRGLTITAVLGNHIFYRLPGEKGSPRQFLGTYAGREPLPAPLPWRGASSGATALAAQTSLTQTRAKADPKLAFDDADIYVPGALPSSEILPRFRQSGSWRNR